MLAFTSMHCWHSQYCIDTVRFKWYMYLYSTYVYRLFIFWCVHLKLPPAKSLLLPPFFKRFCNRLIIIVQFIPVLMLSLLLSHTDQVLPPQYQYQQLPLPLTHQPTLPLRPNLPIGCGPLVAVTVTTKPGEPTIPLSLCLCPYKVALW